MKLSKFIFKGVILAVSVFAFTACSDDDNEPNYWVPPFSTTQGAYILNNGNWGSNDASIAYYDKKTQTVSAANVFESVNNGLKLGDTAQDILVTDNKMYIAVWGSGVIYVTDHKAAIIDSIKSEKSGQLQQPRYFTTYGDHVYVSYYDGYVGRISKKTNKLDDNQVKVGNNPEQLKIAKGKIYVANSGGSLFPNYDKTVSVIDINTFSKKYDIPVIINPTKVEADKQGNIYVISMGDYDVVKSALQVIDTNEDVVSKTLGEASSMCISPQGDKLYYLNSVWSSSHFDSKVYDTNTSKVLDGNFIDESVSFTGAPSSLNIDPQTGNIYIGSSLYLAIGEMHIISPTTGKLIDRFSTGGLNPWGAYFIK